MNILFEDNKDSELESLSCQNSEGIRYEADRIFGDDCGGYQWEVLKKNEETEQLGISVTDTVEQYPVDSDDSEVLEYLARDIEESFEPL